MNEIPRHGPRGLRWPKSCLFDQKWPFFAILAPNQVKLGVLEVELQPTPSDRPTQCTSFSKKIHCLTPPTCTVKNGNHTFFFQFLRYARFVSSINSFRISKYQSHLVINFPKFIEFGAYARDKIRLTIANDHPVLWSFCKRKRNICF